MILSKKDIFKYPAMECLIYSEHYSFYMIQKSKSIERLLGSQTERFVHKQKLSTTNKADKEINL